jgi:hypothetical protein
MAHNGKAMDLRRDQDQLFDENRKKTYVLVRTAEGFWDHVGTSSEAGNGRR